jgi:hypothetical protein
MPATSDHYTLIQTILLAAEQDLEMANDELDGYSDHDIDIDSFSSFSSSSSSSSSLSTESSSSSEPSFMESTLADISTNDDSDSDFLATTTALLQVSDTYYQPSLGVCQEMTFYKFIYFFY